MLKYILLIEDYVFLLEEVKSMIIFNIKIVLIM